MKERIENDNIDPTRASLPPLLALAQGGTAVGTGPSTHASFGKLVAERIAELTGLPFVSAPNKFAALVSHDALVSTHAAVTTTAMTCYKIANDIRFLGSGPRAGLGELELPANEPGSSIMPGKVNPTQCEALMQVGVQIHGKHSAMTFAESQGTFQLNTLKPVMAYNALQSIRLLADAAQSFNINCIAGLKPNRANIQRSLEKSLMLVTGLVPSIGYDKAAHIAKQAYQSNTTLREAAIASGDVTAEHFDRVVDPRNMI